MGTNYYFKKKPCTKCGNQEEGKHIGKSSCGWQFHFRGYKDDCIVTFEDWKKEFEDSHKSIFNEYNEEISRKEFNELVKDKINGLNHWRILVCQPKTKEEMEYLDQQSRRERYILGYERNYSWIDPEGHPFTDREFC